MESLSAHVVRLGCAASAEEMANPSNAAAASATRHMVRCFPGPQRRFLSDIAEKARRFARRMKFRASVRYDNARPERRFRRERSCARPPCAGGRSRMGALRAGSPLDAYISRHEFRNRRTLETLLPSPGSGGSNEAGDRLQ